MKRVLTLLFLISCTGLLATDKFDTPTTFQNLGSRLSADQKQKIIGFDDYLKSAKDNKELQSLLANRIYREIKNKKIGIDLFRDLYERYGVDFQNSRNPRFHIYNFVDLANEYIKGKNTPLDPITSVKILIDLTNNGFKESQFKLGYTLAYSDYFPASLYLMDVWDNYKKDTPKKYLEEIVLDYENRYVDEEITEPDKHLFKQCNNQFKKDSLVLKQFQKMQEDMLTDDTVTEDELTQAYGLLGNVTPLSLRFNNINVQSLLSLLVDVIGMNSERQYKAKFTSDYSDVMVDIYAKDSAAGFIYQKLLEELELDVFCYQDWLMFSNKEGYKPTGQMRILPNFINKLQFLTENTVMMVWDSGVSYQGGFENGRAQGMGKYIYYIKGIPMRIIEGNFEHGKLEGKGKEYYTDGRQAVVGNFHNGLLNGLGHFIDLSDQVDQSGEFINGKFQMPKNYEQYFIRDSNLENITLPVDYNLVREDKENLINYILFKGPFVDNKPNGKGHCYLKELSYDCTFYKGYLVGVEGFSLLPENIVFKE